MNGKEINGKPILDADDEELRDFVSAIKKQEIIHYKMLYRSSGKAKQGSCMFICDRLYNKAKKFIYMGINFIDYSLFNNFIV